MSQRDKAAKKRKRHGTWKGTHRAQRKHRASVIKHRRRAARREAQEIIREEIEAARWADDGGPVPGVPR